MLTRGGKVLFGNVKMRINIVAALVGWVSGMGRLLDFSHFL